MRTLFLLVFVCILFETSAQTMEEKAVKLCIDKLFRSMQTGDSTLARTCFENTARLQTAMINDATGKTKLEHENIDSFMVQIASIKNRKLKIEERITQYDIKIDEPMASVWADYEFYVNDKLTHHGVDAFQLFKENGNWKIIQICDTRKRK